MIGVRINLKNTVKDELLFSALIEASSIYAISVNDKVERIKMGGKAQFKINTNNEGEVINLNVSPKKPTSQNKKARINFVRQNEEDDASAIIIATVDNPYRVTTDGSGRYIIVHEMVKNRTVLNGKPKEELVTS